MTRLSGWRTRLDAVIARARKEPFAWGVHDCALGLAVPAIAAMTGRDLGAPFRGTYDTAAGAMEALNNAGFGDLAQFAASKFPEIHPSHAAAGDLVAVKSDETGWALGIVIGERICVVTPRGFGTLPRSKAVRAFRVA